MLNDFKDNRTYALAWLLTLAALAGALAINVEVRKGLEPTGILPIDRPVESEE